MSNSLRHIPFSGLRIPHGVEFSQHLSAICDSALANNRELLEMARAEPWYMDDVVKAHDEKTLLMGALQEGELWIHVFGTQAVGFGLFTNFIPDRSVEWEGFVVPSERGTGLAQTLANMMISYAFETLKVQKIKCQVAAANMRSLAFCDGLGFFTTGRSPNDWLSNGEVSDRVLLELFNPVTFNGQRIFEQGSDSEPEPDATEVYGTHSGSIPIDGGPSGIVPGIQVAHSVDAGRSSVGHDSQSGQPGQLRIVQQPVSDGPKRRRYKLHKRLQGS